MATSEWNDSLAVRIIKTIFLIIFIIFAIIGNGSVIFSIYKFNKLKTIPNYFVFNLAIADFLFALTGMSLIITTTIAKEWILGDIMCNINGFLNTLFCTVSIWTLVMISINRYFAVAKAQDIKKIYTKKRTYGIIISVWIFSIAVSFPPLVGWSEFISGTNFCTINGTKHLSYSVFLIMADYFFPMFLLIAMYLRIYFLLRKHQAKMNLKQGDINKAEYEESSFSPEIDSDNSHTGQYAVAKEVSRKDKAILAQLNIVSNDIDGTSSAPSSPNNFRNLGLDTNSLSHIVTEENHNHINTLKPTMNIKENSVSTPKIEKKTRNPSRKKVRSFFKEARVTKMLMIVVLGFFICWTPFMVGSILFALNIKPKEFRLMTFGIVIACLNSVINPIIYAVMNRNFRTAFETILKSVQKLCCCFSGKQS